MNDPALVNTLNKRLGHTRRSSGADEHTGTLLNFYSQDPAAIAAFFIVTAVRRTIAI